MFLKECRQWCKKTSGPFPHWGVPVGLCGCLRHIFLSFFQQPEETRSPDNLELTDPLQPITRQVQTTTDSSRWYVLLEKTDERLLLFVVLRRLSQVIAEYVIQEQNELAAASEGKPAITLLLLTLLTSSSSLASISMYCLGVRKPRGSVVLSPASLEDSGRWRGLESNNSTPRAPTHPGQFCPRILCQTCKILIHLHSDPLDPREDGWGSGWPFTCSIRPATVGPLERQLGRNLLPEFWRFASSPFKSLLKLSLQAWSFLSRPQITFLYSKDSSLSYRGESIWHPPNIVFNMQCENRHYSLWGQGPGFLPIFSLDFHEWLGDWTSLSLCQLNTLKSPQLWEEQVIKTLLALTWA